MYNKDYSLSSYILWQNIAQHTLVHHMGWTLYACAHAFEISSSTHAHAYYTQAHAVYCNTAKTENPFANKT